MTAAKSSFDNHIEQCADAIEIFEYLDRNGYSADFGLRFVWVSSISSLDHFVSELIIEKATEQFSNGVPMSNGLLRQNIPLKAMLEMNAVPPADAVLKFRSLVSQIVRFQTYQKAEDISSGLALIWSEKHKWKKISELLGKNEKTLRLTLNSIGRRRDGIVHNADYNESLDCLNPCDLDDAKKAIAFVQSIVSAIEDLVH